MNELEKLFAEKKTENGDKSYNTTGNKLLDILFMTSYFEKHLDEVSIGEADKEKIFSMYIRDPRLGLGRRDLGRELMKQSNVESVLVTTAGRYDDLWHNPTDENITKIMVEAREGNELAKKWLPRLTGKYKQVAKALCKMYNMSEKEYRALIKCESTVEYKMSYAEKGESNLLEELFGGNITHPLVDTINFEQVPSLAMIKYADAFNKMPRFQEYMKSVKEGKQKLNVATTNVYDIYKNKDKIDADTFFDKMEKISINCIPILDTSGSMHSDDNLGKASSIAHYLSKCSTYCNGNVISFSSRPKLMKITGETYNEQIRSMYTGDCSNTDFGAVMNILKELKEFPEYIVVLSDMEFDYGSNQSKNELQRLWAQNNCPTKLVWWNFNGRNKTVPETDEMGNIYISGYSPQMLKYLESGFDEEKFLNKLLEKYKKELDKSL